MDSLTPSCTTLLPLYRAWGRGIVDAKKLLNVILNDGQLDHSLGDLFSQVREVKHAFVTLANQSSAYNNEACVRIERVALETIEQLIGPFGNFHRGNNHSTNGRLRVLEISHRKSERITDALSLVPIFTCLEKLYCNNCPHLTTLPELPRTIVDLNCANTKVNVLPELPSSTKRLYCEHSDLSELPKLPHSLIWLQCSNNPRLADIPDLPDSLEYIDIRFTKAASDPNVIARLEAFKAKNPNKNAIRYRPLP